MSQRFDHDFVDGGSETRLALPDRRTFCRTLLAGAIAGMLPRQAFAARSPGPLVLGKPGEWRIPDDFVGLSYESAQLADPAFFALDNVGLISLFRSLGAQGVLRLGGNSSDFCWWRPDASRRAPEVPIHAGSDNWMPHKQVPISPAAIDNLAGFLDATGWRSIYGLNLGTGTPGRAAEEARYVAGRLGSRLLFFQIGNEPSYYGRATNRLRGPGWDFPRYLDQWSSFAREVIAKVPGARFGGPDIGSDTTWVTRFASEAPRRFPGKIPACTSHYYAEGPPDDPRVTIDRLLAPDPRLLRDVEVFVGAAEKARIDWRMTEGNTCYRGGKPGMSDAFCSALWAADFMLKLASRGCAGLNLHGGGARVIRAALGNHLPGEKLGKSAAAVAREGSFYTPIAGSRSEGFEARPIFYGMKLASLLAGGRVRSAVFEGGGPGLRLYAAEMDDGSTRVVGINLNATRNHAVRIGSDGSATLWRLAAPGLAAPDDVTLAGASIVPGRHWEPVHPERVRSQGGFVEVRIPAASAVAILPGGGGV